MEGKHAVYRRKMNYYETDQMGIIHHSNYIRLFEEARLDMMDKEGISYKSIEEMGIIIPVMSAECHYLIPLYYNDSIEIHSQVTKFDGIKMELSYEIYKEGGGKACTKGHTGHCFLDKSMKPFRMKKLYPVLYNKFKELVVPENNILKTGKGK